MGLLLYFVVVTSVTHLSFSNIKEKYDNFKEVKSFQETYPTQGMSSSSIGFWLETVSYTNTDFGKEIFIELRIYPQENDRMELICHDISDMNNHRVIITMANPTIEDILASPSYC
ncbi:hypothetical protein C5F50_08890 [Nitrosopumilus ureiphilus]|uniref:Uncharacterized protein n=1 Tax=Nitrosopumilus ureiphilus TaxID=1470067 RepID=A0A7D5R3P0_9ARCH|nr:hypothetical protein C5F50_08890 [Nitrosopumilus ureiphilus]